MKLKYEMEIIDINGSPIAVPLDSGKEFHGVLHMNGTARDILEILKNDVAEDEIVSGMKAQYDAAEEDIRRNARKVLQILRDNHLLSE